jgi:tRNA threonylcarbamoyladenosine modification (KEOPS) complex  Pcc1 subunit
MAAVRAQISLEFDRDSEAEIAYRSLLPEVLGSPGDRGREALELSGRRLAVLIEGEDPSAFRAGMYNYSRWLKLIGRLLDKE